MLVWNFYEGKFDIAKPTWIKVAEVAPRYNLVKFSNGAEVGFVGAGGGMMMLLILTSVLGYELKTAVGTSVFIMAFTALTGAVSHFVIGGLPDLTVWALCVVFTLLWAQVAAAFANRAQPKTLNRATGVVLVILGAVIMGFNGIHERFYCS